MLAAHRATADAAGFDWKSAVYRKVEEEVKASRGLTIERMVELGRVSRSGFYRFDDSAEPGPAPHMDLRDAIQRIALEWPSYGRPRITAELRRQDWTVNPKLVYRLMREDNLLCVRKRKFVVTTDSNHTHKVYPNLAPSLILTAPDQLWRADITYIRLRDEFVFPGGYSGRLLAPRHRLGPGSYDGRRVDLDRAAHGAVAPRRSSGTRSSFRSRLPVCQQRLHRSAESQRHRHQYVAQRQSVGQRSLRVVHEDPEVRGGAAQRLPGHGRGSRLHCRVPGKGLQPEAAPFRARPLAAGRVRSPAPQGCRCAAAFYMSFLRHARSIGPMGAKTHPRQELGRSPRWPVRRGFYTAPYPIVRDEYAPAIPWRVALQQSPPPFHRMCPFCSQRVCRSRIFQRTANFVLTVCVRLGGRSTIRACDYAGGIECSQSSQFLNRRRELTHLTH